MVSQYVVLNFLFSQDVSDGLLPHKLSALAEFFSFDEEATVLFHRLFLKIEIENIFTSIKLLLRSHQESIANERMNIIIFDNLTIARLKTVEFAEG